MLLPDSFEAVLEDLFLKFTVINHLLILFQQWKTILKDIGLPWRVGIPDSSSLRAGVLLFWNPSCSSWCVSTSLFSNSSSLVASWCVFTLDPLSSLFLAALIAESSEDLLSLAL